MAKEYKVYSSNLNEYLNKIENPKIKERYKIFFSLHEEVFCDYSNDKSVEHIRPALEALCKLLLFVYVDKADELLLHSDLLLYQYVKRIKCPDSDYGTIKKFDINDAINDKVYFKPSSLIEQLCYAILFYTNQKENSHNKLYNKIKDAQANIYSALNTDSNHAMPERKQSCYSTATLFSNYFSFVHSIIDICTDKLSSLNEILPFENTNISEELVGSMYLDKLIAEDNEMKDLVDSLDKFNHEFSKKYVLIVSPEIKDELKLSLAKIPWNMVIDFDPNTNEEKGLYKSVSDSWCGKRQILYTDIETNGDKITYWVNANGDGHSKQTFSDPKSWTKAYFKDVENKLKTLYEQIPSGNLVLLDLYTDSKLPLAVYKKMSFPDGTKIIRLLSSDEQKIDETTKNDDIIAEVEEYVIDKDKFARYLDTFDNVVQTPSSVPFISSVDVDTLNSYGLENVPIIPLSKTKEQTGNNFCNGNTITWEELYNKIDVRRNGYDNFYQDIERNIISRKKFERFIIHRPCSGGTTAARRLAFDLLNKNPNVAAKCYVLFLSEIKTPINSICNTLKVFIEDKLPTDRMLVLIVDRTISDENIRILEEKFLSNPTYLVSLIRVTYDYNIKNRNKNELVLKESLFLDEKQDFVQLYSRVCKNGANFENMNEVIDFPLSAQHFSNVQPIKGYVNEWMGKIEYKYREDIQHFALMVSLASLYVHDYDRYVPTDFTDPIFKDSQNIWTVYSMMLPESKNAFLKLFEVELNSEGKRTTRIRPRFSLFARLIIENSNIGVYEIAKDYLDLISIWTYTSKMKYVYDVFIKIPDYEEGYGSKNKELSLDDKISCFFKETKDKDKEKNKADAYTILSVYEDIVKRFPDDDNCTLSYAQFLYNKAYYNDKDSYDCENFDKAEQKLLQLLEKNSERVFKSLVYQSLGVLYYRKIGLIRLLFKQNSSKVLYDKVKEYCKCGLDNCNESIELDPTSAYGIVTKAQILKTVLKISQKYLGVTDWEFCEKDALYEDWYIAFNESCNAIFKFAPIEDGNVTSSEAKIVSLYNDLDDFNRKIIGTGSKKSLFDKYSKKLDTVKDEKLKIIYNMRLYDSVISSKRGNIREDINRISDDSVRKIEKAALYNARRRISGSYENLLNLMIFNNRSTCTKEDFRGYLDEWKCSTTSNAELLWVYYYYMVFYGSEILREGKASNGLMQLYNEACKQTMKYCMDADKKEYDTYPYFYYKQSDGFINITENQDGACLVQGTIKDISGVNRKRGKALLDCGLDASFSAKDQKYTNADINVTRLEGIIGFRFGGLGYYKQNIIGKNNLDISEISEHLDADNAIDKADYADEIDEIENIHGTINEAGTNVYCNARKISVKIDRNNGFAYDCSPREYDYFDREPVIFDLKNIQNNNSAAPFYVACNVRPIEDD